jgi:light-regulated signal transduction histidine kinase (bacteriophytochrome)
MIEIKLIDLSQLIEDKKATINIKNLPSMLKCEPMQLGLVFYNLINNGLKFNESPNPTITIDAKEEKDQVIFSVADNGIGIEQKFKDSVFEIFKRLHGGDKYEGTGIGLALCRKIIYRHNGNIWLESEIGKGTTFYFSVSKNL